MLSEELETDVPLYTLQTYHYNASSSSFTLESSQHSLPSTHVLIKTTHSGICFTDVHAKPFGCGLGHEGIGHIKALGSSVKGSSVGDRVGWGWLHTSCKECRTCKDGYAQYCSRSRGFAFSETSQGSMSTARIIDAGFISRIPESIKSLHAAPLMCAGASTFESLHAAGVSPSSHVGVVGIGGLGHMAVLFATAMGCRITAISRTENKRDDALRLGADRFIVSDGKGEGVPEQVAGEEGIDVLLLTSNSIPNFGTFLPLLARRATIVLMTIQTESLNIPYMDFVLPGHRLIASTEANRKNHKRMLEFVAEKKIVPWVEEFEMSEQGIAEAFERLETGEVRFRGVLKWRE